MARDPRPGPDIAARHGDGTEMRSPCQDGGVVRGVQGGERAVDTLTLCLRRGESCGMPSKKNRNDYRTRRASKPAVGKRKAKSAPASKPVFGSSVDTASQVGRDVATVRQRQFAAATANASTGAIPLPLADTLNKHLTEEGLKRIITRQSSFSRRDIDQLQPDELGRRIAQEQSTHEFGWVFVEAPLTGFKANRTGRTAAKRTGRTVAKRAARPPPPRANFWNRIKKEIHIFICTNDKKYADARRMMKRWRSQTLTINNISIVIGAYTGAVTAFIAPLVAAAFLMALEVGANAYCARSLK